MAEKKELLTKAIRRLETNSHICGFYKDEDERLEYLAAYYKVGTERKELCILVTEQRSSELIEGLLQHDFKLEPAISKGDFHILPTMDTYLPNGTFESAKMLEKLRLFVKNASKKGYPGVRGGGDMDWLAMKPRGWEKVGQYEAKINRFMRSNNFTGLCLFHKNLLDSRDTQEIIQTHQYMLRGSQLFDNPHYLPPDKYFKFDVTLVSQIEAWLDDLDAQEASMKPA